MPKRGESNSKETRKKMSIMWVKRKQNPNYIPPRSGTVNSKETRKKISMSGRGVSRNKGMNNPAYGKRWKTQKKGFCVRCKQEFYLNKNTNLCKYCEAIKGQVKRLYNLSIEEYDEITKECLLCKFAKIVSLHHLNGKGNNCRTGNSRQDNRKENMIGLCPNHHRLLHSRIYSDEIHQQILKKLEI